jgi:hypothetical protein
VNASFFLFSGTSSIVAEDGLLDSPSQKIKALVVAVYEYINERPLDMAEIQKAPTF